VRPVLIGSQVQMHSQLTRQCVSVRYVGRQHACAKLGGEVHTLSLISGARSSTSHQREPGICVVYDVACKTHYCGWSLEMILSLCILLSGSPFRFTGPD
jgi:hypothetical protein